MKDGLTAKAAHATWWSAVEISIRFGAQFAVTMVLARLLTPEDFGLMAILMVFMAIGALIVDSGFGAALIQRQASSPDDETTVFGFSLAVGIVLGLLLIGSASPIAGFFARPELEPLLRFVAWLLPMGAFAVVPDALLTMRMRFRARALVELASSSGGAIVAVTLAHSGHGVWSLAWQAVAIMGIRVCTLWLVAGWRPRGGPSARSFRAMFGFGSYMLSANLLDVAFVRMQSLLIGKLFDATALGYFTLAQNTQQAPTLFVTNVLNRVGLPLFSRVAHDSKRLREALRRSLRIAMFLFFPCLLGLSFCAASVVRLLYGDRWAAVAPLLSILCIGASIWPMHVLNLAALTAQGRTDLLFWQESRKKIVAMLFVLFASPWGGLGIASAVAAMSFVGIGFNTWYTRRLLAYGPLSQLADQRLTMTLTGAALVAAFGVVSILGSGGWGMSAAMGAAVFVYIGGAFVVRHPALDELMLMLSAIVNRTESSSNDDGSAH